MNLPAEMKEDLKKEVVNLLSAFTEVQRIVIFGSFVSSDDPHDLDIAVFQDSDETYYPLAMKYRRTLRPVARKIPLDVLPIRPNPDEGLLMRMIRDGEVVYER